MRVACVAFACKCVALLSTACEHVCLDVLTRTFVFYHTVLVHTYNITWIADFEAGPLPKSDDIDLRHEPHLGTYELGNP